MNELKRILLAEDSEAEVELTLGLFWALINQAPPRNP